MPCALNRTIFGLYRIIFVLNTKRDVKAFRYCEYIYIGTANLIMRLHNGRNKVAIELRVVKSISLF